MMNRVFSILFLVSSQLVFDTTSTSGLLVLEQSEIPNLIVNLTGHTDDSHAVAWSPDGSLLASGSDSSDCSVRIWDWQEQQQQGGGGDALFVLRGSNMGVNCGITSLDWSPDGTKLLAGRFRNEINLWNITDGTLLWAIGDLTNRTYSSQVSVAWHPSGEFFAASIHNVTMLLNSTNGEELNDISSQQYESVNSIAWSSMGRYLAIGSGMMPSGVPEIENNIKIWDRNTDAYIYTLTLHTNAITAVAWSPDGARLVSASLDQTCKIWNVASETVVRTLGVGVTRGFQALDYSSDGTLIASGSYDHSVQIWDAFNGMELARFFSASESKYGRDYVIMDVAWHPTMNILALSKWESSDSRHRVKTVEIWDISGVRATGSESPTHSPVSSSPISSSSTAAPSSLRVSLVPTELPSILLVPTESPISADELSNITMQSLSPSASTTDDPASSASKTFCNCVLALLLGISILVF